MSGLDSLLLRGWTVHTSNINAYADDLSGHRAHARGCWAVATLEDYLDKICNDRSSNFRDFVKHFQRGHFRPVLCTNFLASGGAIEFAIPAALKIISHTSDMLTRLFRLQDKYCHNISKGTFT